MSPCLPACLPACLLHPTHPAPPHMHTQVKADDVKYVDPARKADMTGIRAALGDDYEARLRAEAGAWA